MDRHRELFEALPEDVRPDGFHYNPMKGWWRTGTVSEPVRITEAFALIEHAAMVWCIQNIGSIEYCTDFDGNMVYAADYHEDYTLVGLLLKVMKARNNP